MLHAQIEKMPEIELTQPLDDAGREILSHQALRFLADLCNAHQPGRDQLLKQRQQDQQRYDRGQLPDFDPASASIRDSDWCVAPIPDSLSDRRTEITGPVDRKMVINALNSSAQVFMADFEDSTSPTWRNLIDGQINLRDAVEGTITHDVEQADGSTRHYRLNTRTAILMVRCRGLHLPEANMRIGGRAIPGCLVDLGLFLFHNQQSLRDQNRPICVYLPKLEHGREAAWWEAVLVDMEQTLGLPKASVRVTVLIETLPAAFQMDEILHALRHRILGLNCGRWDYIFSYIKTCSAHAEYLLPDRDRLTMDSGFLQAYSRLLIATCHRRGAFAMGGMAAQIPVRGDEQAHDQAMQRVRADKAREAGDGHDGTWVAHPALESIAREEFDRVMPPESMANQIHRTGDVDPDREALLAPHPPQLSDHGIRTNARVAILYLAHWLDGQGCVPIDHLMEDAATAEIARAQLWQWLHHQARIDVGSATGPGRTGQMVDRIYLAEVFTTTEQSLLETHQSLMDAIITARDIIQQLTFDDVLAPFITTEAYPFLSTTSGSDHHD